jgi:hypothetical protein
MFKDKTTAETLKSTRTYGQVRCPNPTCLDRLLPKPGEKTIKCPKCGTEWRVVWLKPDLPRIRGPVWETNIEIAKKRLEELEKKGG